MQNAALESREFPLKSPKALDLHPPWAWAVP